MRIYSLNAMALQQLIHDPALTIHLRFIRDGQFTGT